MCLSRSLAAALLLLAATASSWAQTASVAGRDVQLPLPAGYCALEAGSAEGRVVERIRYGIGEANRLLMVFADCGELTAMRAAPAGTARDGFAKYGTYVVTAPKGEVRVFDQMDRGRFIQLLSQGAANGPAASEGLKRAEGRLRELRSNVRQVEGLGVLDVDAHALYVGVTGSQDGPKGPRTEPFLGVVGSTLVKGLNVSSTIYQVSVAPGDLSRMLSQQKAHLASLVAANP